MKIFRLITLDIMGTLMDITAPVGVGYSETAARYGINISPQLLSDSFSKVWNEMKVKHPNYGLRTGLGWEKWWTVLVHETFVNSTTEKLDSAVLHLVSNKLISSYNRPDKWKCNEGALEFVNYCHDKQITLAVLSNFDKRLEELLESMGVRKYFRFVVASYTIGFEKPDQRIFSITENIAKNFKDLQDLKKSEILHIGDTPEYDYIPARNAGWCAYLIHKNSKEVVKKHPDISSEFIFNNFFEIKQTFQ